MSTRPTWFNADLFPVESRWVEIDGNTVHYVDEGEGPLLLMLHGNPTWSFLYRRLIAGLKDRFRCVALDYPGFGLSAAKPGYDFTPAAHADVLTAFIKELDLTEITPIVQDWGGPIGLAAATRDPDRFSSLIIGNTWAWPHDAKTAERFSFLMGSDATGDWLTRKFNLFVGQIIPRSMRRRSLKPEEMAMYKGPFPDEASRTPVQVFPREITGARDFLAGLESNLHRVAGLPSLLLWANKDIAFGKAELEKWRSLQTDHHHHMLQGAGHYWQDDAGEEAVLAIRNWWDNLR
jgi:haloalkane dehalogenase